MHENVVRKFLPAYSAAHRDAKLCSQPSAEGSKRDSYTTLLEE